jgi:hypothetical protein
METVRFLNRINRDDIRVVESRNRLGLALEPLETFRVRRHLAGKKLQGDFSMQLEVFGDVHLPHAATAESPNNAVVMESGAYHGERNF